MRLAIIGQPTNTSNHTYDWKEINTPNLADYEAVILDFRSLQARTGLQQNQLGRFTQLLSRLLVSNGIVVAITPFLGQTLILGRDPIDGRKLVVEKNIGDFLLGLPRGTQESGATIVTKSASFSKYLQNLKAWNFHFVFGAMAGNQLPSQAYAVNREGKMLAGEVTYGGGRLIVLPEVPLDDPRDAISLVVEELTGQPLVTQPPEWANEITIPGMAAVQQNIDRANQQISDGRVSLRAYQQQFAQLARYRALLYATGPELEEIVSDSLVLLGGKIEPARYGTEEYILIWKERENLLEVKGVGGTATVKQVMQLVGHQTEAEAATGTAPHGILVVNAFRNEAPATRGVSGNPIFPTNVIARAKGNDVALITGADLLAAVVAHLEGKERDGQFLDRIVGTTGPL